MGSQMPEVDSFQVPYLKVRSQPCMSLRDVPDFAISASRRHAHAVQPRISRVIPQGHSAVNTTCGEKAAMIRTIIVYQKDRQSR